MRWMATLGLALGALALLWVVRGRPSGSHRSPVADRPPIGLPQGLTSEGLIRLRAWLEEKEPGPQARPERDIFQRVDRRPMYSEAPPDPTPLLPTAESLPPAPRLAGFVFRDEEDGSFRALAAIRFEGRVWLVGEGEVVGTYRVERIVVEDEEVFLVETAGGQESRLSIE